MPFIEIKKQIKDFIRIKSSGSITISSSLINLFRDRDGTLISVKIFHDGETKKIGFKPDKEGYKINSNNNRFRIKCSPISKIVTGEFFPKWSEKHKMLVFSYA